MTASPVPTLRLARRIAFLIGMAPGMWLAYWVYSLWLVPPVRPLGNTVRPAVQPLTYADYLVLGIDALSAPQPKVEAVWLASVPSDHSLVKLLGLPPAPFRDQYSPSTGLPLLLLQPYLSGSLAGSVVFDRADIVELTERLGGVWLLGQEMDGAAVLNFIDSADPNQPNDLLVRQGAMMQSFVARAAAYGVQLNLRGLLKVPSQRSVSGDEFFELVSHYRYPLRTGVVRIRLAIGGVVR